MAFQIGDTVRLISGNWYTASGANLVGAEYVIVADDRHSEYYIDAFTEIVEISATRIWPECFELVATKPEPQRATLRKGDTVELLERYDQQSKGDQGIITSTEISHDPLGAQMIYVDFGSASVRGRPIGMYDYRVKRITPAALPAGIMPILQMIETTSKRVGTGDTQAILFSLMEEVGELATEINIENGTKEREPSEDGVEGEAIDVLVVIGDLLTSLFGSLENPELHTKVAAKLAKWERKAR